MTDLFVGYDEILKRRKQSRCWTYEEKQIITEIELLTDKGNVDNISRTNMYEEYYIRNKAIKWAFLASMVSRNAGWNMTDLEGVYYPKILPKDVRQRLFLTYERANWFIFSDAYPQLLLYEYAATYNRSLFYLLPAFSVSLFMEAEWERFWVERDEQRLLTALIVNEQQMIQKSVIEHPYFKEYIFDSMVFKFQELLHFSAVVFPTLTGHLYGFSVHDFVKVEKRIELGKKLGFLLFHPTYEEAFAAFANQTNHTGSRADYEQYFSVRKERDTPYLREVYPIIPHQRQGNEDWFHLGKDVRSFFESVPLDIEVNFTQWFLTKQKQLHLLTIFDRILK